MRIALFDVTHWHFPLYIPALTDEGVTVVGLSDRENFAGADVARRLNCPVMSRDELLEVDFDFALVFGRHNEMATTAKLVIAKGKPFMIEKPCGVSTKEVEEIRLAAEKANVFVTVPFILRVSDLARELSQDGKLSASGYRHLSFRFIVGPSTRYEKIGCSWVLDKKVAGGGSIGNVGVHFFELLENLTGSPIVSVTAQTQTLRPDSDVDHLAIYNVTMASGQIAHVHTGYLYPSTAEDQREFSFSVSHEDVYLQGFADQIVVKTTAGERRQMTVEYNTDAFYPIFLRDALQRVREGREPLTGLKGAQRAVAVVEAGFASSAQGGAPVAVPS